MKNILLACCCVLLHSFDRSRAQVALEIQPIAKGESERCRDGDSMYMVGDTWSPNGTCTLKSCSKFNFPGYLVVHYSSCGKIVAAPKECQVSKEDLSKTYPNCCPKVTCH